MDFRSLTSIIKKHGLKPATERDLPLFTMSCIGRGYGQVKDFFGFDYGVVGALGNGTRFNSYFNEEAIAKRTFKLVSKHRGQSLKHLLAAILEYSDFQKKRFAKIKRNKITSPYSALLSVCDFYPKSMVAVGAINCIWRLSQSPLFYKTGLSQNLQKLSKIRNDVTSWYPEVEAFLGSIIQRFPKDLPLKYFRCMTVNEMARFAVTHKLPISKNILIQRSKGYFYLIDKKSKETVITDQRILKQISRSHVPLEKLSVLKGQVAYRGKVKGRVFLGNGHLNHPRLLRNYILVASSTHPEMIRLIKKAGAIVTDEGGLLSHAAIISRELKKPCIIGTKIATKVFKDGDVVEVDAETGVVRKKTK